MKIKMDKLEISSVTIETETDTSHFSIKNTSAGCQWLTPVILAIWEAEIRRIAVQSQPGQIVHEIPSPK
jgi:hypothetical protein